MADALTIIPLQSAKDYLVVDYPDRDAEITRHIKSAVAYVEKYTNVMLYEREKVYTLNGCSLEIYDAPITFVESDMYRVRRNVLSSSVYGKQGEIITTTVGYASASDVPSDLIEACYKLITYLFENRDIYTAGLPWDIAMLINPYRRSATF